MHKLEIDHLTKRYYVERDGRQVLALSDVSLSVAEGEFVAIVGPSGCGKTTLLNIVAGLLTYDLGTVAIDGRALPDLASTAPWSFSSQPAAVADDRRQRALRDGAAEALRRRGDARARRVFHPARRADRLRAPLSLGVVGRDAAARQPRARAGVGSCRAADGRAVRGARRADARAHAGRAAQDLEPGAQDRGVHHASDQRSGLPRRSCGGHERRGRDA